MRHGWDAALRSIKLLQRLHHEPLCNLSTEYQKKKILIVPEEGWFSQPKYSTPTKKILLRCVDFCFYFLHEYQTIARMQRETAQATKSPSMYFTSMQGGICFKSSKKAKQFSFNLVLNLTKSCDHEIHTK